MTDAARPATHADSTRTLSYEQAGVNYELIDPLKPKGMAEPQAGLKRDFASMIIENLRSAGVHAFLVGETFMRAPEPGLALAELFA